MHEEMTENVMQPAIKLIPAGDEILSRRLRISETRKNTLPEISVEEDLLVPDIRPDLEKILSVDAVPEISSWETYVSANDAAMLKISGNLEISTLYVPSGRSDELIAITSRIPFRYESETAAIPDKRAEITPCIKNVSSRVINERKIRISVTMDFKISDYGEKEIELLEGVTDDSLLLRKEKISFTDMAYRKNDSVEISEKIKLRENQPEPVSVLKYEVNAVENHRQISKGKIILEGSLYYTIMYIPADAEENVSCIPVLHRGKTDFTQFIRLPDLSASEISGLTVNYDVSSADIKLKDSIHDNEDDREGTASETENRKYFQLDAVVDIAVHVYREIERELVTDMYHRTRDLDYSICSHRLSRLRGTGAADVSVRDTLTLPDDISMAEGTPLVAVKIGDISVQPENGRCQIEGQIIADIIFAEENTGEISCRKEIVPFKSAVDIPGVSGNVTAECCGGLKDIWFDRLNSRQIDFSCGIALRVSAWDVSAYDFIDRVCYVENENRNTRKASMVVYMTMPEDTQWSIAKKFRTDMETICEVNGLEENQPLKPGSRLLIV